MSKFKKGDKVKLRDDLEPSDDIPEEYLECCKYKIYTVENVCDNGDCVLVGDGKCFIWHEDMLESPYADLREAKNSWQWLTAMHVNFFIRVGEVTEIRPVKCDEKLEFKVGDKVYNKYHKLEGEILYVDIHDTRIPYLVGFKGLDGYKDTYTVSRDIRLEIGRKGYLGKCKWCYVDELEPVKEVKEDVKI